MAKLHLSRCRIFSLISTILAINISTVTSYSLGECAPCSKPLSCASDTPACNVTPTPCSSKHWTNPAGRDANTLYCVANYTTTCAQSENQSYRPCTIYNIIINHCNAYERCVLSKNGRYAVLQEKRNGCFVPGRYMLVTTRPCTGVDSSDPLCTGPEGEVYWQETWEVATKEKSFPSVYDQNATWTMLINPINGRSQQQMHFKFAYFIPDNPIAMTLASSSSQTYSTNTSQPTINIFKNNTDVTKDTVITSLASLNSPDYDILSSVFIPAAAGSDDISSVVRPFETAMLIDQASVNGTIPYGIMVFPYQQQEGGGGGGDGLMNAGSNMITGFVVSNFYNLDGSGIVVRLDGVGDDCRSPPSGSRRVGNGVMVVGSLMFALFFLRA